MFLKDTLAKIRRHGLCPSCRILSRGERYPKLLLGGMPYCGKCMMKHILDPRACRTVTGRVGVAPPEP